MARKLPRPLNSESTVEFLISQTRGDGSVGDLCTWEARSLEIPPEDLRRLLREKGIGTEWSPVEIRESTAARKAITKIRPMLEEGDLKVLVRRVETTDPHEVRYALIEEETDRKGAALHYREKNQIVLNREYGSLDFTNGEIPSVRRKFDHLCSVYTQREVKTMTRNIVEGHGGTKMRNASNMWFLPSSMASITDALMSLYNDDLQEWLLPDGRAFFKAVGVTDHDRSVEAMSDVVVKGLEEDLFQARNLIEKALDQEEFHARTVSAALERYSVLRGKLALHRSILPARALEEVEGEIERATEVCHALLETETQLQREEG